MIKKEFEENITQLLIVVIKVHLGKVNYIQQQEHYRREAKCHFNSSFRIIITLDNYNNINNLPISEI